MSTEPEPIVPAPEVLPPAIPSTPDDRTMALLCHIGGAFLGFLAPLIIWLVKKDQSKFVDDQGKEALNFHLTMLIGHLIGLVTCIFTFGLINMAIHVMTIVFAIMGGIEANKGNLYRYPICIRFIK